MSAPELEAWLVARVAALTQRAATDIGHESPLTLYGLDSVDLLGLAGELEELLGRRIDPQVAWRHPTIAALARQLAAPAD